MPLYLHLIEYFKANSFFFKPCRKPDQRNYNLLGLDIKKPVQGAKVKKREQIERVTKKSSPELIDEGLLMPSFSLV
jgi:hypothetical protein